ncbi:MAG: hypothetical protein OXH52_16205 [Gammaproteobacteria bacterium]|nr:hypothetical protein [Gammaproteobacteria bacterium]
MELFDQSERVRSHGEWSGEPGWELSTLTAEEGTQLTKRVLQHAAGVTILSGDRPLGSGVLIQTEVSFGVLTAGHVCRAVKDAIHPERPIGCLPHGVLGTAGLEEVRADVPVRELPLRGVVENYDSKQHLPDYGCLMLPPTDARDMMAWGTFVNLTRRGPSRRQQQYWLERNAWVSGGYLQERSWGRAAYHWHAIGGPEAVYERDGRRYLYIKIPSQLAAECPKRLGGMSGSGVWEIPISRRRGEEAVQIGTPILRGVTFWQGVRSDDGGFGFYAHELESIADHVGAMLDEGQPRDHRVDLASSI